MRKLILIVISILSLQSFAQQSIQGTITYKVTATGSDAEAIEMMNSCKYTEYFKNGNLRIDMTFSIGTSSTIIKKGSSTATLLMSTMGQKNMMYMPMDKQPGANESYTITETSESKTIAGVLCKKAIIKSSNGQTSTVWYAPSIANSISKYKMLNGLKGFPLEYTVVDNGTTLTLTATSISTDAVADSTFETPQGYNLVTTPYGNH